MATYGPVRRRVTRKSRAPALYGAATETAEVEHGGTRAADRQGVLNLAAFCSC